MAKGNLNLVRFR